MPQNYVNRLTGFRTQSQLRLNAKEGVASETVLKDLGTNNNLAFVYEKGLIVYCNLEGTRYEWKEVETGKELTGLRSTDFIYPAGVNTDGVDYSNKKYNFFKVESAVQVNSDWNSTTGISKILNKPSIPTIVPQIQTDWSATDGLGVLLNKPTIPAAQVQSDWNSVAGLNHILNKPSIPNAQISSDWTSSSGVSQILNKPTINIPPFEKIDEGNGDGFIIRNRTFANYGSIGAYAFDLSSSGAVSTVLGATGTLSFCTGYNNTASGYAATVFGGSNSANGTYSFAAGSFHSEVGYANTLFGVGHSITSGAYATVVGQFANVITNNLSNTNDANNTMFAVGNGMSTGSGTMQSRSTAFLVKKDGSVLTPSLTTTIINSETTGKVSITREYLNLQKTITAGIILANSDNNYTIIIANGVTNITITIPVGLMSKINVGFIQQGTGNVTFVASGTVINTASGMLIKGQHYCALIQQVETSNVYQLAGNLKL